MAALALAACCRPSTCPWSLSGHHGLSSSWTTSPPPVPSWIRSCWPEIDDLATVIERDPGRSNPSQPVPEISDRRRPAAKSPDRKYLAGTLRVSRGCGCGFALPDCFSNGLQGSRLGGRTKAISGQRTEGEDRRRGSRTTARERFNCTAAHVFPAPLLHHAATGCRSSRGQWHITRRLTSYRSATRHGFAPVFREMVPVRRHRHSCDGPQPQGPAIFWGFMLTDPS